MTNRGFVRKHANIEKFYILAFEIVFNGDPSQNKLKNNEIHSYQKLLKLLSNNSCC